MLLNDHLRRRRESPARVPYKRIKKERAKKKKTEREKKKKKERKKRAWVKLNMRRCLCLL